jgi:hypothetical protein
MYRTWTAERVREGIAADSRALQGRIIPLGKLPVLTGRMLYDLTGKMFGEKDLMRRQLLTRGGCDMRLEPFSAACADFGWARATVERHLDDACQRMADHLNQRDAWERAALGLDPDISAAIAQPA